MSRHSSLALALLLALPGGAAAQAREPFPAPFAVEHHAVDGSFGDTPIVGETVRDTYAGSFLVSERPDGGRTIVDFSRRELTEVRPADGTYWSLPFGRFSDLKRRLEEAESLDRTSHPRAQRSAEPPAIRVQEVNDDRPRSSRVAEAAGAPAGRRLRASVDGGASLDVWVDPAAPRLTAEAQAALAEFERQVLGPATGEVGPAELLDAVRRHEGGAFPVRTRRVVSTRDVAGSSVVETVVTKVTPLPALPARLLAVPEGFRRVASPLEIVVAWAEEEASRRRGAGR